MKQVPFVSIRVISDTPGKDNNIEQYNNFWEVAPEKSFDVIKDLIYKL
jgi:adenosylhomocysteine nucleosidase